MGRRAIRVEAGERQDVEAHFDRLAGELADIRSRLEALERHLEVAAPAAEPRAAAASRPSAPLGPAGLLALVGRSLVVLGGALVFRAATDSRMLPASLGVALGLGYAALFLVLTDREAGRCRRASALGHAITAIAVAHALLFEATARFGALHPAAAGGLLVAFLAGAWLVAIRRGLAVVAAVASLATLVTALALLQQARDLAALATPLLVMAVIAEGAWLRGLWPGLRWPAALGVDLLALVVIGVAARPGGMPESWAPLSAEVAATLLLLVPLLYLSSAFAHLGRGSGPRPFDVVQMVVVLPAGLGGAVLVLESAGHTPLALGVLATALGVAGYASLGVLRARPAAALFASAVALALVLAGTVIATTGVARVAIWSTLSLGAAALVRRAEAARLELHAAAYLLAAASAGGLLLSALAAFVSRHGATSPPWPGVPVVLVALAAVACHTALRGDRRAHLPERALAAALLGATAGSLMVKIVVAAFGAAVDPAIVAAVRTLVLAGLALLLARSARPSRLPELTWLSHAVLVLGGLKLLVEDLPQGSPVTLFLGLTTYGGALLAVSRLARDGAAGARSPGP